MEKAGQERQENAPDEAARLRALMDDAAAFSAWYGAMAGQCEGRTGATLRGLAQRKAKQLGRLQTEFFLLTGDSYWPSPACPLTGGVLSGLRRAILAEQRAYADFMKAAQSAATTAMAGVYIDNAAEELQHAQELRRMLETFFTPR